jgi:hypothetical protein
MMKDTTSQCVGKFQSVRAGSNPAPTANIYKHPEKQYGQRGDGFSPFAPFKRH